MHIVVESEEVPFTSAKTSSRVVLARLALLVVLLLQEEQSSAIQDGQEL